MSRALSTSHDAVEQAAVMAVAVAVVAAAAKRPAVAAVAVMENGGRQGHSRGLARGRPCRTALGRQMGRNRSEFGTGLRGVNKRHRKTDRTWRAYLMSSLTFAEPSLTRSNAPLTAISVQQCI